MSYTSELIDLLQKSATNSDRIAMEAYMKNKFDFIGIRSEKRKNALREFIQTNGLPTDDQFDAEVQQLWKCGYREVQYCAQELFERKKWWKRSTSLVRIEWLIKHDSWWDTVDFLAANSCGNYFLLHPERAKPTARQWNQSGNIWLVRSSLLYQLKYKSELDLLFLKELILPHLDSNEFFIQKAIGWALRQASKSNPDFVRTFIKNNPLKPVSLREASKYV